MKNTAILLIFSLCVLGLFIGVYYTEAGQNVPNMDDYDEVVHEDSNGTITITLELKEKNSQKNDEYGWIYPTVKNN